ncbi:hypothetical protein [Caulobacter sp. LARHSG274]
MRHLAPALCALMLAAAPAAALANKTQPPATEPAGPVKGQFVSAGDGGEVRFDGVSRSTTTYGRGPVNTFLVQISIRNRQDRPALAANIAYAFVVMPDRLGGLGYYNLTRLRQESLDYTIPAHTVEQVQFEVDDDDRFQAVEVRASGSGPAVLRWTRNNLALNAISSGDLKEIAKFAGAYRTSLGGVVGVTWSGTRFVGVTQARGPRGGESFELVPTNFGEQTGDWRVKSKTGEVLETHRAKTSLSFFTPRGINADFADDAPTWLACRIQAGVSDGDFHYGNGPYWIALEQQARRGAGLEVILKVQRFGFANPLSAPFDVYLEGQKLPGVKTALQPDSDVGPCQVGRVKVVFSDVHAAKSLIVATGGLQVATWALPPADQTPTPGPAPTPPPSPGPAPAPSPAPFPAPQSQGDVPVGAGTFQTYGIWAFKVDELGRGPDGQWQAVVTVRNAANSRFGMVASEIKVFLINADGQSLVNWGDLYKASVIGPASALEKLSGVQWMEPGDQIRLRLRWDGSRTFKPTRLRLQSTGASATSRTFDLR